MLKNSSDDSPRQQGNVEIDEKADGFATQFQVGEQLSFMNRQNLFDALQLKNDLFLDNQIQAVAAVQFDSFVVYRHVNLTPKADSSQVELMAHALFIRRFQKSGTEVTMTSMAAPMIGLVRGSFSLSFSLCLCGPVVKVFIFVAWQPRTE
jgi:hypothetical protein